MKKKGLLLSGLVIIAIVATFSLINNQKSQQNLENLDISFKGKNSRSFKGAAEFYKMIKADPRTGKIDPELVSLAYEQADRLAAYRADPLVTWESRGPDNMGGRIRGFVVDNVDPDILYASGVSGGIYKSTNGGKSWVRKTYDASAGGLIVSCMTQASDGTIYFGTGEGYFNAMSGPNGDLTSGSRGGGVYKSTDRGETWEYLDATDPQKVNNTRWLNVQKILADPTNSSILYAATYSGFMKSTDAGESWTRESMPGGTTAQTFIDIAITSDGKTVYTASYASGRCKLHRSSNGGAFTQIAESVSEITNSTRLTIAIAPSNEDVVYVVSASNGTSPYPGTHSFGGLYKSIDKGDNWTQVVAGHSEAEPFGRSGHYQGQYDNCVAVDPTDETRVFVGGVEFYSYYNGQWYKAASTEEYLDAMYKNPLYIHADKHNIVFDTKSNPIKMYVMTDGGVYVSSDFVNKKYPTFSGINIELKTTQFYAIAVHPRGDIVGGTQDQNSIRIEYDGLTGNSGLDILGGDGFYAEISRYNPDIYFYESQEGKCYRSKTRGSSGEGFTYNPEDGTYYLDQAYYFNSPFRLWEDMQWQTFQDTTGANYDSLVHVSKFFFVASQGVWMTEQAVDFNADSVKWFNISKGINSQIISMEYSSDGDAVFVGTKGWSSGRLYRISGLKDKKFYFDANGEFDPDDFGIKTELLMTFNNRSVCGIGISPSDDNTVAVALGNYVNNYDHVYLSTNALDSAQLVTFTSIHGNLPNTPAFDVAFNSQSSSQDTILVATELGVYATTNGGASWTEENTGMDRVPSFMFRQFKKHSWSEGYTFFVATHGMGVLESNSFWNSDVAEKKHEVREQISVFPNPATDYVNVKFILNSNKAVSGEIYNISGRLVKKLTFNNTGYGENLFNINTSNLPRGSYIIRLKGEGTELVERFLIVR
jgi:photosystem II stability/assembly factor-like uncharacterized protein